ncbi:GHKL domain-containing protein [Limosilactobacillus gastricus]|nr:GHKL domain-containing protein [Limosilactobacillus gastricus]
MMGIQSQQFIADYLDILYLFIIVRAVIGRLKFKDILEWVILAVFLQIAAYAISEVISLIAILIDSYVRGYRKESKDRAKFEAIITMIVLPTYLMFDNTLSVYLWITNSNALITIILESILFIVSIIFIIHYKNKIANFILKTRSIIPSINGLLNLTCIFFISSLAIYVYSENVTISLITVFGYTVVYYLIWLIMFMSVFMMLKEYNDNLDLHLLKQKYEDTINLNQAVSQQYEQVRHRQHDIKNLLIDLQGQIKANQSDTALKMIQDQLEATPEITMMPEVEANLNKITSSGIQNVIRRHLYEILAVGASVNIEVSAIINFCLEDEIKLARIIGILLDNARDALKDQENGVFQLSMSRFDAETVVLAVRNSIDQSVDVNQMIKNKFSTKDNHHGYGLTNIREIVNGDDHFNLEIETSEHFVTVELYMRGAR